MSKNPAQPTTIQADKTLMSILEALYESERAGVTELSEQLDISKSTVHKHLVTIERQNYVERTDGDYRLGMRLFQFGGQVRNQKRLCFMAKNRVETVAAETDEMTKFAVECDGAGVWTYFHNDHYEMRRDMHVGDGFELHQNATGKAILAELPTDRVHEIIDEHGLAAKTERTITDRKELLAELDEIRATGLARSDGEFREGGISVAAPVRDPESGTVGAIALAGPASKTSPDELIDAHGEFLLNTAKRFELQLRYV